MLRISNIRVSSWKMLLFIGDLGIYFLSIIAGYYLTWSEKIGWSEFIGKNILYLILIGIIYFLIIYTADIYNYQQDYRRFVNIGRVFLFSLCGTAVVALIFYYLSPSFLGGRTFLLIQALTFTVFISCWRVFFSIISLPLRLQKRILIVGAGGAGCRLLKAIRERPASGFLVVGFVDDDPEKIGTEIENLPVLGASSQLHDIIKNYQIVLTVVAITHEKSPNLLNNLIRLSWNGCQVMDMPNFFEYLTGKVPTGHISEDWIFQWNLNRSRIYYRRFKRLFDIFSATFLLALTWPIMILIALAIKLDSKGPIFFRQDRLGQERQLFKVIKFRSMVKEAESLGPNWTRDNDPRITRVGKIIRKMRLDELPQLINILIGDMSFIGPRPLAHDPVMEQIPYFNYRLLVKPGITGWAQVMYPDGLELDTTHEKLKFDLYYIKNMCILLELSIIFKTMRILLFKNISFK
ncbi:MAG: sugar transferase [Thermodesulfobacteriota bacterium]